MITQSGLESNPLPVLGFESFVFSGELVQEIEERMTSGCLNRDFGIWEMGRIAGEAGTGRGHTVLTCVAAHMRSVSV